MVGLYHFGNGDWKILPGVTTTNWLVMRDGKRSLYFIGIGAKICACLGEKFLAVFAPK